MPLPKPKKNESKDDFIERCMGNNLMNEEYPDEDQRYAVCLSQWNKKSALSEKEVRSFEFSINSGEEETRKMEGHAAVFGEPTDIGGWFLEQVEPGAFKSSIRKDDIRALFNHDENYVLGRNKAKTLKLSEDEQGLRVIIDPPDTQYARDLAISIERGDINQMSFAFQVLEEEWINGEGKKLDLRKIKKARLFDVSPVTFPAYEGTDIAIRSHEAWRKDIDQQQEENEPLKVSIGQMISNKMRKLLLAKGV